MNLSRHGIIAGPSSGEALCGLLAHLHTLKAQGRLGELAETSTGEIHCVFVCADLPYQYMDLYFKKLGIDEFPPTFNEVSSFGWSLSSALSFFLTSCSLGLTEAKL